MDSEQYSECVELYSEYVNDIAVLFKELNFESNLASCFAYRYCLERGFLSKNSKFSYIVYKDHFDCFVDLYGASVATGGGCCRHTSSLLVDVINEMGGKAANISVTNVSEKENEKHMITGVVHNGNRLAVDTTVEFDLFPYIGAWLFKDAEKNNNYAFVNYFAEDFMYRRIPSLMLDKSKKNCDRLSEVVKCSNYEGELDEIVDLVLNTTINCLSYDDDFKTFSHDEQPKIKRLSKLVEYIAPHGEIKYIRQFKA